MFCVIHADARALYNFQTFGFGWFGDEEVVAEEVVTVEAFIDAHGAAEEAGTLRAVREFLHGFESAEENSRGVTVAFGNDIHAVIHPIDEIDVGVTRRAKHDFSAFGESAGGMGGEVVGTEVSLGFDDTANAGHAARLVNEQFTEQFLGDESGVAVVERARQFEHRCKQTTAFWQRSSFCPFEL